MMTEVSGSAAMLLNPVASFGIQRSGMLDVTPFAGVCGRQQRLLVRLDENLDWLQRGVNELDHRCDIAFTTL